MDRIQEFWDNLEQMLMPFRPMNSPVELWFFVEGREDRPVARYRNGKVEHFPTDSVEEKNENECACEYCEGLSSKLFLSFSRAEEARWSGTYDWVLLEADDIEDEELSEILRHALSIPQMIALHSELHIREFGLGDVKELSELTKRLETEYRKMGGLLREETTERDIQEYHRDAYAHFGYGYYGVFDEEEHLLGIAGAEPCTEESYRDYAEFGIALYPDARKNGVGRMAAESIFPVLTAKSSNKCILVRTDVENVPMRRLSVLLGMKLMETDGNVCIYTFDSGDDVI